MISVLSKKDFLKEIETRKINDTNVEHIDEYFICIDSTGGPYSNPWFLQSHKNVCNLKFDDVDKDIVKWGEDVQQHIKAIAPTKEQIQQLYDFIDSMDTKKPITIYCTKGQSRSVAVRDYIEWKTCGKNKDNGVDGSAYYFILEGLKKCTSKN